jgi:murein DD-endopeptidase MepM/ murein hydrolase activator NlpD
VTQGATVGTGEVIGLSGNTGRSTAPHLHFEIRRRGTSLDPLTMVKEGR